MSRPAFWRNGGFRQALNQAGDADLVDHLGELAGAARTHQADQLGKALDHRRAALSKASSPPHMTVKTPFSAPAWPPDTGASIKPQPFAAAACSSRATSAEAVVLSMKIAPGLSCRERRRPGRW
jgi:hypothetical protein